MVCSSLPYSVLSSLYHPVSFGRIQSVLDLRLCKGFLRGMISSIPLRSRSPRASSVDLVLTQDSVTLRRDDAYVVCQVVSQTFSSP